MTKKELVEDMKRFTGGGGFITKKELVKYLGRKDISVTTKYTSGLSPVNGKYFFIGDIADKMIELEKGAL